MAGSGTTTERRLETERASTTFITAYALAYLGMWVALLTPVVVTLAVRVQQIDPDGKEGSLALVTGVGALLALVANPFFGHLSDRTTSRFGMRRPWLVGGALTGTLGLAVVSLAQDVPVLLIGWCIAQAGLNAVLAVLTALLPDQVPAEQRGRVSGLLGMAMAAATVLGTFLAQALQGSSFWMFMAPSLFGLVSALLLASVLRDRRLEPGDRPRYDVREFARGFWVNPVRNPDFGWAWLSRFLLFMGVATLLTYQAYYLTDRLHVPADEVARLVFVATLVQTGFVVAGSNASGWLSDRLGRRKIFVLSSAVVFGLGLLVIGLAGSFPMFLVGMALTGLGQGVYLAVDLALVADVLPNRETDAAKDLGVFNIANAMPQSLAPAIAPVFLAVGGGGNYPVLFGAAAVFAVIGALSIQPVRRVR
ncbi:MFS transporter [Saccharopolyspora terrae]|uniref:MFS transporter n=1 Tax=Saccharopolyspora terrae TaxID=2530384 RepID=A0A4V2YBS8_9PSEU|nr:MFS transporter [Saccharopolyspora terrae]TDD08866.1 MFS transporter [Saccharopolyspora terrae]